MKKYFITIIIGIIIITCQNGPLNNAFDPNKKENGQKLSENSSIINLENSKITNSITNYFYMTNYFNINFTNYIEITNYIVITNYINLINKKKCNIHKKSKGIGKGLTNHICCFEND